MSLKPVWMCRNFLSSTVRSADSFQIPWQTSSRKRSPRSDLPFTTCRSQVRLAKLQILTCGCVTNSGQCSTARLRHHCGPVSARLDNMIHYRALILKNCHALSLRSASQIVVRFLAVRQGLDSCRESMGLVEACGRPLQRAPSFKGLRWEHSLFALVLSGTAEEIFGLPAIA